MTSPKPARHVTLLGLPEQTEADDQELTLAELATYLGKSRQTLYQWRARGRFPFQTRGSGRNLKVARREVDAYLAARGEAPAAAAPSAAGNQGRSLAQDGGAGLELRLAPDCQLQEVAAFLERVRAGGETRVVMDGDGCRIQVL